jgi:hypothetical protein
MSKSLAAAELRVDKAPSLFPGQLITNVIAGLQAKGVKLR